MRRAFRKVASASSQLAVLVRLATWRRGNPRSAILSSTPVHGNLGDQAIVLAESRFLADMGFGDIVEVERIQYMRTRGAVARLVRPGNLVVIDGGGNVGTLWSVENDKMNDVVSRFRGNPIIVFPQTAYFEDSEEGEACKRAVGAAYGANPNLLFFSRDRATYDVMREVSPRTKNLYVPDVVLYLDESRRGLPRSGALLCLRSDKERVTADSAAAVLRSAFEARGLAVRETDTVVTEPGRIDACSREAVLDAKWNEFASAEVVVTDRLHGMLFSAITGTPCVALDNVSRKVSQGYEWIRHLPYVRVASSADEVPALLDEVLAAGPQTYDRAPLEPYFDLMKEEICKLTTN